MQTTLIFIHIPKTAGATFSAVLARRYPKRTHSIYSAGKILEFAQMPEAERSNIDLLQGHFPYGIHELINNQTQYITFLRNPIERTLSWYYYVLREPENYLHPTVVGDNVSLEEFVNSSLTSESYNLQVRMIGGGNYRTGKIFPEAEEANLQVAKAHLTSDFTAFGLTERFDESLALLGSALEWQPQWRLWAYRNLNITRKRKSVDQISPEVIAAIRRNNNLDLQLYEYACTLFNERVAKIAQPKSWLFRFASRFRANAFSL